MAVKRIVTVTLFSCSRFLVTLKMGLSHSKQSINISTIPKKIDDVTGGNADDVTRGMTLDQSVEKITVHFD